MNNEQIYYNFTHLQTKQRHTSVKYPNRWKQIFFKIWRNSKEWQVFVTHTVKFGSKTSVTKHSLLPENIS